MRKEKIKQCCRCASPAPRWKSKMTGNGKLHPEAAELQKSLCSEADEVKGVAEKVNNLSS